MVTYIFRNNALDETIITSSSPILLELAEAADVSPIPPPPLLLELEEAVRRRPVLSRGEEDI
jgi:hypothetical protein